MIVPTPRTAARSQFQPDSADGRVLERPARARQYGEERRYRPEIDGLRAIAVVLVILYHARIQVAGREIFSGGFIGVDIFLVISGYLIGLILLREIGEQRFSIVKFYERRARRILPALYVVLLTTLPLAWLLMLPDAIEDYAGALVSAAASLSNVYFWHEVSYDATSNLVNPLIHTWSLGLEEQFYLLFPGLLLFLHRFVPQRVSLAIAGLSLVSFVAAEVMTAYAPDASFFLLPARIWELGIGALLALSEIRDGAPSPSRFLPLLGLCAIFVSLPFLEVQHHHPGLMTLLPVLGTAAVIRYGGSTDPAGRWLSSRPMVGIGLISYSLYLWHQPVFAFGRIAFVDEPTGTTKLGWILLSLVLAIATFALVERPLRNRSKVAAATIWMIALGGAVLLIVSGSSLLRARGVPRRLPYPTDAIAAAAHIQEADIFQAGKGCLNYVPEKGPCRFARSNKSGYDLLLIGDSHARALSGSVIEKLDASQLLSSVTLLNRGGCPFLLGLTRVDGSKPNCPKSYNIDRLHYVLEHRRAIAVLMMRLPVLVEQSRFNNGSGGVEPGMPAHLSLSDGPYDRGLDTPAIKASLATTVNALLEGGAKVVLVYPVPEMGWNVPRKLFRLSWEEPRGAWLSPNQASVSYGQFKARTRRTYELLDDLGERPDLLRVYPERVLCKRDRCLSHDGTSIFYRDDNHLSKAGADRVTAEIMAAIEQRWGDTSP